jgi:hypothetical protein
MDLPNVRQRFFVFLSAVILLLAATQLYADPAPFDLAGPKIEIKVTRGAQTLAVTQVPNLAAGDKLWIHPDFPTGQAAHYLLIAAFLRGSTNPPPENWFFKAETWDKKYTGLTVTVPEGAQQVIVFLAPETGGDFKTLVNAVRGRPGSFVRASQDLNQASLDRSRLDVYLSAVHRINTSDPDKLKDATPMLARSLNVQLDKKCLDLESDLQAACLTQKQDGLVLNDGHSMSIVEALTTGPTGDLTMQASYTPQANYGYYSPYVASIIDMARILDSFHNAQYQYIPAIAALEGGAMELKLNTPPSFHNPKSVIVVALPAIESSQPPPLHPIDEKAVFCAEKSDLVLPVDGAPLVFSTKYAHNLALHLESGGKSVDLPLTPEAVKGGFGVDIKPLAGTVPGPDTEASVKGNWGFDAFTGPKFHLQGAREQKWQIASADEHALLIGRDDTIHLEAQDASCIDSVMFKDSSGKEVKADYKLDKPNSVEVKLPLKEAKAGDLTLTVKQAGLDKPSEITAHTYSEAGHLDSFTLHAGDHLGLLKGSRLDEVASLSVKGVKFVPGKLSSSQGSDELPMTASDTKAAEALTAAQGVQATATLKDGRTADLQVTIDTARPRVTLLGKNIESTDASSASNIELANQDEIPQNSKLVFSIKAQSPATFTREDKVEVATGDDSYSSVLNMGNGTLTLQDSSTALATFDPAKAFGGSAFGPLAFRIIDANGVKGDWQQLATLVRLPQFQSLKCPSASDQPCKLSGANLFLVDAVSGDSSFSHPVQVPDGFPGSTLPVPHPSSGELFVKLRDDPSVVNQVKLTAENVGPPAPSPAPSQPQVNPIHPVQSPDGKPRPDYTRPSSPSSATPAPNNSQTSAPAGSTATSAQNQSPQSSAPPATQPAATASTQAATAPQ